MKPSIIFQGIRFCRRGRAIVIRNQYLSILKQSYAHTRLSYNSKKENIALFPMPCSYVSIQVLYLSWRYGPLLEVAENSIQG